MAARLARLSGFHFSLWHGLWRPKGTPKPLVAKLNTTQAASLLDCGSAISLAFPRTSSCAVAYIMNDHLVLPDFIHDQIIADRHASEFCLARCLADVRR